MDMLCDTHCRMTWTIGHSGILHMGNVSAEKLPQFFTWLWMFPTNYGLVNQQYKCTEMLPWKFYHEQLFSTQNTKVFLCGCFPVYGITVAGSGNFPFHSIFHTVSILLTSILFHHIFMIMLIISTLLVVTSYLSSTVFCRSVVIGCYS